MKTTRATPHPELSGNVPVCSYNLVIGMLFDEVKAHEETLSILEMVREELSKLKEKNK